MFGIGTPELILIIILALLIIGPKELPRIGREMGKVYKSFQRAAEDMKESINREIEDISKEAEHELKDETSIRRDRTEDNENNPPSP